jgi:hypothetical protein
MLVAAIDGDIAILKMILDRTEGKVQPASTPIRRVELHFNFGERIEAAQARVLAGRATVSSLSKAAPAAGM